MSVTTVGSPTAASVPKINPMISGVIASLFVAFRDIDFSHQSDVGFPSRSLDALINVPVVVERGSNDFHFRRHPLYRADACGSSFFDGFRAPSRHPDWRVWLLNQRNAQLDIFTFKIFSFISVGWASPHTLDHVKRFQHHFAFFIPRDTIGGERKGTDPSAESALQATLSQIIQHSDFFGDPNGIPQRQHINQGPQSNIFGSLRQGTDNGPGAGALRESQI